MSDETTSTLSGLFKQVYAANIGKLVPESSVIKRAVEFSEESKVGDEYHQPVLLSYPHGFSFNGTSGNAAFTLNGAVALTMKDAKLAGSEIVLQETMAYGAAYKAAAGGEKSFKSATRLQVEAMMESMSKQLEHCFLYGQQGLGQVSSIASGVITITAATWTPALWAGMEGAILQSWSTQAATATQRDADLTISEMNLDDATRTVTVTGTSTATVANDWLYFKGARTSTAHNQFAGLDTIARNTGTLFNISATTYGLWKSTLVTAVTQITMGKILNTLAKLASRGLRGKVTALIPPKAWEVLNSDLAALRKLDSSYTKSKGENGVETISFYGQTGEVELMPHLFVRDGDLFLVPMKKLKRVGATDITFSRPGAGGDDIYLELSAKAGFEIRCYADQAIFCETPAQMSLQTGITYA